MKTKSCSSSTPAPAAGRLRREPGERLMRIHQLLSAGKFPNIRSVAAEFRISPKTIKRDFQYLRDHYDAPLAYDRQRHGLRIPKWHRDRVHLAQGKSDRST